MKRLLVLSLIIVTLASCSNTNQGELVGVRKKTQQFYQPDPYGMVFVPMGSYTMGVGGQDVASGLLTQPKTISISSFFMDETEITNNEYREFVAWVRDSIARTLLGEIRPDEYLISENHKTGEIYDPPYLNWNEEIEWNSADQDIREALAEMYFPEHERFFGRNEIDTRKLFYEYFWIDLHAAAKKEFRNDADYRNAGLANRPQGMTDRSTYIKKERINVYPDTLAWLHDYSYSFNDPLTEKYFWHRAYDNYPVVGVNWNQAKAFCIWRTEKLNKFYKSQKGDVTLSEFRLPTEAEWEFACRGGLNTKGLRFSGSDKVDEVAWFDYNSNGKVHPIKEKQPNELGLYDMSGNLFEWCYDWYTRYSGESLVNPQGPATASRRVLRGGCWNYSSRNCRSSYRLNDSPHHADSYYGLRLAMSVVK